MERGKKEEKKNRKRGKMEGLKASRNSCLRHVEEV